MNGGARRWRSVLRGLLHWLTSKLELSVSVGITNWLSPKIIVPEGARPVQGWPNECKALFAGPRRMADIFGGRPRLGDLWVATRFGPGWSPRTPRMLEDRPHERNVFTGALLVKRLWEVRKLLLLAWIGTTKNGTPERLAKRLIDRHESREMQR